VSSSSLASNWAWIGQAANECSELRAASLPFDHVSAQVLSGPQAVFYFSPTSSASPLLDYLDKHASAYPSFQYNVRYRPPIGSGTRGTRGEKKTALSGFGVELALKKTDYLVVDDRATSSSSSLAQTRTEGRNQSGLFSETLGPDPWAELASPLTAPEVYGESLRSSKLWHRISERC
jgi:UDP-glucose:glycoprotein glucosyltransferase